MQSHLEPKQATTHENEEEEEAIFPPVSPISQSLNSSTIALIILAVFEFETPITESQVLDFIRDEFIPMSPRLSSTIVRDKNGIARWKKVETRAEDHLVIPTFPSGLQTREQFDQQLREYLSQIGCQGFSAETSKPLWEVHLIKYPSLNGARTLVFKLNHAIGDGYSFARLLFFAFKRAGNPSLPLSIPQISMRQNGKAAGKGSRYLGFLYKCLKMVPDIVKFIGMKDGPNAIRSESTKIGFRPFNITYVNVSFEKVKQVKSKLGATVNDVIMGIISYVIHLYMVRMGQVSNVGSNMTILVMLNTRILKGYKSVEEMLTSDTWGNYARFLTVPIPSAADHQNTDPLEFIIKAKETMNKTKDSLHIYLIEPILNITRTIKGQKGLDELVHTNFYSASTMITSVVGPKEQMAISENPVNSFYFLVTGIPQSLTFTSVSCNGELKLVATMEKGFIDSQVFTSCMNEAFQNVLEAALDKDLRC